MSEQIIIQSEVDEGDVEGVVEVTLVERGVNYVVDMEPAHLIIDAPRPIEVVAIISEPVEQSTSNVRAVNGPEGHIFDSPINYIKSGFKRNIPTGILDTIDVVAAWGLMIGLIFFTNVIGTVIGSVLLPYVSPKVQSVYAKIGKPIEDAFRVMANMINGVTFGWFKGKKKKN